MSGGLTQTHYLFPSECVQNSMLSSILGLFFFYLLLDYDHLVNFQPFSRYYISVLLNIFSAVMTNHLRFYSVS